MVKGRKRLIGLVLAALLGLSAIPWIQEGMTAASIGILALAAGVAVAAAPRKALPFMAGFAVVMGLLLAVGARSAEWGALKIDGLVFSGWTRALPIVVIFTTLVLFVQRAAEALRRPRSERSRDPERQEGEGPPA